MQHDTSPLARWDGFGLRLAAVRFLPQPMPTTFLQKIQGVLAVAGHDRARVASGAAPRERGFEPAGARLVHGRPWGTCTDAP
jgi:hypothetical protein